MKPIVFLSRLHLSVLLLFCLTSSKADVLVDSFATPQSNPGAGAAANGADGSGILGGERNFLTYLTLSANGTVPNELQIGYPTNVPPGLAGADIIYAGVSPNHNSFSFGGLGSVDLTQGGINDRFRLDITAITNTSATLQIEVRSFSHGSSVQVNLPLAPGVFDVPFAEFQHDTFFDNPIDFHNVGYIDFHIDMNNGGAIIISNIVTTVPEPSPLALMCCLPLGLLLMRRKPIGKSA